MARQRGFGDALRRRDRDAWTEAYRRLSDQIFGFLLNQSLTREEAEDLTALTFTEAIKAAQQFKGEFADLRAWIFRIARNNLIDYRRQTARRRTESLESMAETQEAESPADTAADAIASLEAAGVRRAIEELSPEQREVLLLRLTGGLTSAEIGEIVGKTPGAIKALVHRALKSLSTKLTHLEREKGDQNGP